MSANGRRQNLWKDMLSDLQQRTAFWLKKIQERMNESCDDDTNKCLFSVTDDKFQQMLFAAVNNR